MSLPAAAVLSESADQPGRTVVVEAGAVTVPTPVGGVLAQAEFSRQGADLVIRWSGGDEVVVRDYASAAEPAALNTAAGEHLRGDLVARLAGPLAPAQFAQAAQVARADPLAAEAAIGRVVTLDGVATATRPDGTVVALSIDTPIGQG
ncbi:MAG: hypothetical protein ACREER_02470, partial [Alphaproteobacteria bacterium]